MLTGKHVRPALFLPRLDRRGLLARMPGHDLLIGRRVHDPEAALCARHFHDLAGKAARTSGIQIESVGGFLLVCFRDSLRQEVICDGSIVFA